MPRDRSAAPAVPQARMDNSARSHDRSALPPRARSEEHTSELQSHRDLHSFPTRRSSDLHDRRFRVMAIDHGAVALDGIDHMRGGMQAFVRDRRVECREIDRPHRLCPKHEWIIAHAVTIDLRFHRELDRKSTRLNSSHTEIYTLSLHDALPISMTDDFGSWR